MAEYADFLSVVRPEVPNAPKQTMVTAIKLALRELCERSHIWTYTMDPAVVYPGNQEVDLEFPSNAELVSVQNVDMDSLPLSPDSDFSVSLDGKIITLSSPVKEDKSVTIKLALRPSYDASSIEQWLVSDYLMTVAHGALAILFAQSGREWFNPNVVAYHTKKFSAGVANATIRACNGGKVNRRLRVKPHTFA
ncbi:MAG: hypothetical protein WCS15_00295 [Prevotella sp.]|nr:hypothetical protein [Massilibacteroides sp.]